MRNKVIALQGKARARVNSSEAQALERLAAYEGLDSLSEAARLAIREAARARGLWPIQAQGVENAPAN